MARPKGTSKYTEELADKICMAISTSSKGLVTLCRENADFPNPDTVYEWLKVKEGFSEKYTRAREAQADLLADEIIEIADNGTNDTIKTDKGDFPDMEWINRSRLRVDARKWKASKLAPKKYGDKIDVTTGGDKIKNFVIELTDAPDPKAD